MIALAHNLDTAIDLGHGFQGYLVQDDRGRFSVELFYDGWTAGETTSAETPGEAIRRAQSRAQNISGPFKRRLARLRDAARQEKGHQAWRRIRSANRAFRRAICEADGGHHHYPEAKLGRCIYRFKCSECGHVEIQDSSD